MNNYEYIAHIVCQASGKSNKNTQDNFIFLFF